MMSLQQITCNIAVSWDSGFNKNYRNTFAEKLKSKPKATEERNACLSVCDVAEIDVRQSAILQIAKNYTTLPIRDLAVISNFLSLSKAMKISKGVQELSFFDIDCKNLDTWILFAWRAEKTPEHLFVVKFYGRVNTIKVMSNQSVNLVGSRRRLNAYSSTFDFRIEVYIIKIFYNAVKFVSYHSIVTTQ